MECSSLLRLFPGLPAKPFICMHACMYMLQFAPSAHLVAKLMEKRLRDQGNCKKGGVNLRKKKFANAHAIGAKVVGINVYLYTWGCVGRRGRGGCVSYVCFRPSHTHRCIDIYSHTWKEAHDAFPHRCQCQCQCLCLYKKRKRLSYVGTYATYIGAR